MSLYWEVLRARAVGGVGAWCVNARAVSVVVVAVASTMEAARVGGGCCCSSLLEWFLYLWILREFLVLKVLPHSSQARDTCMWSSTWLLMLLRWSDSLLQTVHLQTSLLVSSFLYFRMRLEIMFGSGDVFVLKGVFDSMRLLSPPPRHNYKMVSLSPPCPHKRFRPYSVAHSSLVSKNSQPILKI